jgi:hypothetical protein
MAKAGLISDYLDSLAAALNFDRSLSRSVREEVEDHLQETIVADPTGDKLEAERRAVANFGDSRVIAAQFAVVALARRTRHPGVAVILVMAGVFATMKARVAWYAATQWAVNDDMRAVSGAVSLIDRYSFWFAVAVGIAALAYIGSHGIPAVFHPGYRRQLRRSLLLCAAATGSLVVSVACDGVLTGLQLIGTELCVGSLLPILSMAIELGCAGVLIFRIHDVTRKAAFTAALLNT